MESKVTDLVEYKAEKAADHDFQIFIRALQHGIQIRNWIGAYEHLEDRRTFVKYICLKLITMALNNEEEWITADALINMVNEMEEKILEVGLRSEVQLN